MSQMTAALSGDVSTGYDGTILVGVPV